MTILRGTVTAFDDGRGDGLIRDDGGREFYVHCVEVSDGSRTLAAGSRVLFVPIVGHLGRDEASQVQSALS